MGDEMFDTPEVKDLAKDPQAIQDDVQVHKASTHQQPKKRWNTSLMSPIWFIFIEDPFFQKLTYFTLPFSFLYLKPLKSVHQEGPVPAKS